MKLRVYVDSLPEEFRGVTSEGDVEEGWIRSRIEQLAPFPISEAKEGSVRTQRETILMQFALNVFQCFGSYRTTGWKTGDDICRVIWNEVQEAVRRQEGGGDELQWHRVKALVERWGHEDVKGAKEIGYQELVGLESSVADVRDEVNTRQQMDKQKASFGEISCTGKQFVGELETSSAHSYMIYSHRIEAYRMVLHWYQMIRKGLGAMIFDWVIATNPKVEYSSMTEAQKRNKEVFDEYWMSCMMFAEVDSGNADDFVCPLHTGNLDPFNMPPRLITTPRSEIWVPWFDDIRRRRIGTEKAKESDVARVKTKKRIIDEKDDEESVKTSHTHDIRVSTPGSSSGAEKRVTSGRRMETETPTSQMSVEYVETNEGNMSATKSKKLHQTEHVPFRGNTVVGSGDSLSIMKTTAILLSDKYSVPLAAKWEQRRIEYELSKWWGEYDSAVRIPGAERYDTLGRRRWNGNA